MSNTTDYYIQKLHEDYSPRPVFAEISTGNWLYALAETIKAEYGNEPEEWQSSLSKSFSQIQNAGDFPLIHKSMRALSQGMSLCISFQHRKEQDFLPWNTVGLISDFYYAITNIFDAIILAQTNTTSDDHTKRINVFDGVKSLFPHPFDMSADFDITLWRSSLLVNKEHFQFKFPQIGISTNSASEGLINDWHNEITETLATDILLGYLRGTTGFQLELKCNDYKKSEKISSFRRIEHKNGVNPRLKNVKINFLTCLYRYRTKAHYRDFIYLTWNKFESSIHKSNNYIDARFVNSIYLVTNFSVCVAIKYLEKKIGRVNTQNLLTAVESQLKPNDRHPWAGFI